MVGSDSRAGVTLMELLIAVTLVGLLSLGMVMAIRVGLMAMQKTNTRLMGNRRVLGAQRILEQQIANLIPVMADCIAGQSPVRAPFFQGEPQSMRLVTSYSLEEAARGYARLVELLVIPRDDGRGVRLVANELLYTGPRGAGTTCLGFGPDPLSGVPVLRFVPIQAGPRSFVLADRLAACRFMYREELPPPVFERWVPRWLTLRWPSAVRVEMMPLEPGGAALQAVSMTVPVRVNREPGVFYADQ